MKCFPCPPARLFLTLLASLLCSSIAIAAPGDVETGFPSVALESFGDLQTFSMAVQPDGKIIIGGTHDKTDGLFRGKLTRLNADGTQDTSFKSYANGWVHAVAVQADGKILVAGAFDSIISPGPPHSNAVRRGIARLNADGSLDATFDANITGFGVTAMAVQADGKILIAGSFTEIGGTARTGGIARLNSNGTLDIAFNPVLGFPFTQSFVVMPDGSIFLVGSINSVGGVARYGLAKLTSAGVLDTTFDPGFLANASPVVLAQPDGKLLVAANSGLIRLTSTGAADATFTPLTYDTAAVNKVESMVLQADGKVIIGGRFTSVNGTARNRIARIHTNGTLDTSFNADGLATTRVFGLMLQDDGRLLVGCLGGLKRVLNDVATESLTAPSATSVEWLRGSTMPEVASVQFEQSTNGTTWTTLGAGTRTPGGWQLTGTSVTGSYLRARAATLGGYFQSSSSTIVSEAITPAGTPQLRVQYPASTYLSNGAFTLDLGAQELGASSASFGFTVLNEGTDTLKRVLASISGPHASDFSVVQLSQPNLAISASRVLNVAFKPTGIGTRSATLHITSNDPATPDFSIALTGTGALSSNANLASLSMTSGVFTPAFAANTLSYMANVQSHVASFTLTPTVAEVNATFTINTVSAASGVARTLNLNSGANVFSIVVTAQNGSTQTYTLTINRAASVVPGDVDPTFNPASINAMVRSTVLQTDGKLILAGYFNEDPGHLSILRLNADGTLDTTFNASVLGGLNCVMLLESGKILIAGYFTGIRQGADDGTLVARKNIALLNADGTVDTSFNTSIVFSPADPINGYDGAIECLALQTDGKILVGGNFNRVGATTRVAIARLTATGALDTSFNAGALDFSIASEQTTVNSIVQQADGKIVFGGQFDSIGAAARGGIARVSTSGALEAGFNPALIGGVSIIRLLPDQRLLVSSTSADNLHNGLVLLSSAGVVDASYTTGLQGEARSMILQTDGSTLLAGQFDVIYDGFTPGPARNAIARLSATGVLDAAFDPSATMTNTVAQLDSLMVQEDGKIVVGGSFDAIGNITRIRIARLANSPVTQSIANIGQTTVEWLRGGAFPEAEEVRFDLSTDGGATFTALGAGTRISGGWQLTGLNLPVTGGILRGRARVIGGYRNGSSGFTSFAQPFSPAAAEIVVEQPVNTDLEDGVDSIEFGTLGINVLNPVTVTIRNAGGQPLTGLSASVSPAGQFSIIDQPNTSVDALDSTTFIVQAKITTAGAKTATLTINSNDADEALFTLTLNATGAPAVLPTAATTAATAIAFSTGTGVDIATATLNGTVDAKGQPRTVSFDYGLTTAYGMNVDATPATLSTTGATPVSAVLTDLPPHTTYHYRVRIDGDLGNALGTNKTFTTPNHGPVAVDDVAINLPSAAVTIDVLDNDTDADLDNLTITAKTAVTPATAGTVAIVANQLVFTASANFGSTVTTATFGYTVSDGFGLTDTGSVTVTPGGAALDLTTKSVPSAGITYPVEITTTSTWAVTEALTWATVSPSKGFGTTTVQVTLLPNTAIAQRVGTVKIGGVAHAITQAGVLAPTVSAVTGTLNSIVGDQSFSLTIPTTNPPVTYSVTSGTLPPGITINQATGVLSGVPTKGGVYPLVIKATNLKGSNSTPSFTINIAALQAGIVGTFHGYVERSSTVNLTPNPSLGARFELTTNANGSATGQMYEGVIKKPFTGQITATLADEDHPTLRGVIAGSTHVIDLTFDNDTDTVSGTLHNIDNTESAAISAWGNAWSATAPIKKASAYKAQHNFYLQNTDTANGPQGFGYGSFIVTEGTGALTINGKLPDGSTLLCTTFIGQQGQVLLYQALHANRGSCFGKLTVTPVNAPTDNTVAGSPTWFKPQSLPAAKDTVYAAGFSTLTLDAKGSTYLAPAKGQIITGFIPVIVGGTNAKLAFTEGGLAPDFDQLLRLFNASATGLTNSITIATFATGNNPNKVTMTTFTAPTGLYAGNFTIPGTPVRLAPFFGQIVRVFGTTTTTQGYGYFLLPSVPGTGQTVTTSPKLSGKARFVVP